LATVRLWSTFRKSTRLAAPASPVAVGGNKAQYIGGTVAGLKEKAEGRFNTTAEDAVTFTPDKIDQVALAIPYASITELEYGQKAGRRVAVGILISPWAYPMPASWNQIASWLKLIDHLRQAA
jgi:hypothetical protein